MLHAVPIMLKNYFTIALRNLYKYWVYSLINIAGLAVGISFFTLLFLIIQYEISYDTIHSKSDRIYRLVEKIEQNGVGEESASLPFGFGPKAVESFPDQVENMVRIFNFQLFSHSVSYQDERDNEGRFYFADSTFFQIFDFPLLKGNPKTALLAPNSVVISEAMAKKYFGEEDPIGKVIFYEDNIPLTVTGVLTKRDYASHFEFDFLASLSSVRAFVNPLHYNSWVWNPCWTYLLLKEDANQAVLEQQFAQIVERHFPSALARYVEIYLQPLRSIHLKSNLDYEISSNGDVTYIYIFAVIAILILVITVINFTNLSTARYSMRAKEIGIRKAIGADKSELIQQFFVESIFISTIGIICAFVLVEVLLPHVALLTDRDLTYNKIDKGVLVASVFGSGLVVGFLSSLYPSYYLSRFLPAEVLNGAPMSGLRNKRFRSILVVLQFCITIYLLISTLINFQQVGYMRGAEIGFEKEQIVMVPMPNTSARTRYDSLKAMLLQHDAVKAVTHTEEILGAGHQTHNFMPEWENPSKSEMIFLPSLIVGYDFIETFDIQLLVGRSFHPDSTDETRAVIVNQELVRFMEWGSPEEALGKTLRTSYGDEKVVGVVENFNFESLHEEVTPFVLDLPNTEGIRFSFAKYIAIRVEDNSEQVALAHIEKVWDMYVPNRTFEYFVLSNKLNNLYMRELKLGLISGDFSLVAIFIACLGLFGLSSFVVEQKRKEIAIRKAIGTTNVSIIALLSSEFLSLVGVSLLIAWPFSYFMMNYWLSRFPFHIEISMAPFITSGIVVLAITLLTVSYHTIRAALKNPVQDLNRD